MYPSMSKKVAIGIVVMFALAGLGVGLYFMLRKKKESLAVPDKPPATKKTLVALIKLVNDKRKRLFGKDPISKDAFSSAIDRYRDMQYDMGFVVDDDLTTLVEALKDPDYGDSIFRDLFRADIFHVDYF